MEWNTQVLTEHLVYASPHMSNLFGHVFIPDQNTPGWGPAVSPCLAEWQIPEIFILYCSNCGYHQKW